METKTKLDLKNLKACSFDTNILLRWLLQDDEKQAETVQSFLDNPKLKKVYICDLVILEVVWVMESVYKLDRYEIKEGLEIVLEYPKFVVSKDLFRQVLVDYVKNENISYRFILNVF